MDSGCAVGLAIGLATVGCADSQVVLGCNASASTSISHGADSGGSDAGAITPFTESGSTAGDADGSTADAVSATSEAGATATSSCQPNGPGLSNCGSANESCCTSLEVPGGTFFRTFTNPGNGAVGEADPATVSSFRLDKYLVTVGRFRQFVSAWNGGWTPPGGAGKHAHLNKGLGLTGTGGTYEPGWVASDDSFVSLSDVSLACTVNDPEFLPNLAPGSEYSTWTSQPGAQENLPINCVNWYEAYAFCIWDGGFLPSQAEWEYAAFGGSEQLEYPWGSTAPGSGSAYAIYGCNYPCALGMCTGVGNIAPVGSAPMGAGLWGHLDLVGNLFEWNVDWFGSSYVNPCQDCANLTVPSPLQRVVQGGDFNSATFYLPPAKRKDTASDAFSYAYGIRCARTP